MFFSCVLIVCFFYNLEFEIVEVLKMVFEVVIILVVIKGGLSMNIV